jgi:hypothetical protein
VLTGVFTAWLLAICSCPGQDGAQPPAKQPEAKVKVTVVVILASERCQFIDPRLKNVAVEVQKKDAKLTGFTLVSMTEMALGVDVKVAFPCVEDCTAQVLVHHCVDNENKVCLAVTAPLQNEIVYKTVCDKFLPIVTCYQTKERVPAKWIATALLQSAGGGPLGSLMACDTIDAHRCRDRLILAIRVQACKAK